MSVAELTTFQRKLAEHAARQKLICEKAVGPSQGEQFSDDLIPEVPFERSDGDALMDKVIDGIDILDAYRRWCGKMVPVVRGNQTESIMISCPTPNHTDKVPSAWINTDKQTWFCGGCEIGGDAHDIAAYHFGYPVPAYKTGPRFHELRQEMAKEFGFTITKLPGGITYVEAPVIEPEPDTDTDKSGLLAGDPAPKSPQIIPNTDISPAFARGTELTSVTGTVTSLDCVEDDDDEEEELSPELDWRQIIPQQTFLNTYMELTTEDDAPEEYHFWNALLALGFALGRDVSLIDTHLVYGNLFVCTLGRTGSGKSKAASHFDRLVNAALPHDWNDAFNKGVIRIESPGSAEALIHAFQKPISDPSDPKKVMFNAPVRGIIDFNELSALIGKASRIGNVTIPVLQSMYDMKETVANSSMTHGRKEAYQPFASLLTTTQPKALKGLLNRDQATNGFLNRWVFAPGRRKQRIPIGEAPISMLPAVDPLRDIQGWAASFTSDEYMLWSGEARAAYIEFDGRLDKEQRQSDSELLSRADLLMKKLILLFTANRMLKIVPIESVKDAIACWPYVRASFALIDDQIDSTVFGEMEKQVKALVVRFEAKHKGKGPSISEIGRLLARKKYPTEQLLKCCRQLVEMGDLSQETTKIGSVGKPTVRYKSVT